MGEMSSTVDRSAKSGTLLKDAHPQDSKGARRRKRTYLERLTFTEVVPDCGIFTHEQLGKLTSMAPDEQKWRNSFFDSLIHDGLLIELQRLPTEELRQFVFMKEEEQGEWREKLVAQKAHREQQHESELKRRQTQQPDKLLARMHNPHKDEYSSLELRLLPPVRKLVDYYAAGKGMVAAECVESIVVDALNKNPDILEKGEKRLKEFGGNLTRAKRHAVEEKLARLQALEAGSSSHHR